jgi:purine-binding chemotaxis protein CheW
MNANPMSIKNRVASHTANANEGKYLSFSLGNEHYGLEITKVREIIGLIDVTPLPQTPKYVRGVMNLRGKIIPVIDLRTKFNLPSIDTTKETCTIVVEGEDTGAAEPLIMGVVVDAVREVTHIAQESIEPAPEFGFALPLDYIMGIGKVKDKVVILLHNAQLLNCIDQQTISQAAAGATHGNNEKEMTQIATAA